MTRNGKRRIAYFSMEIGLHSDIPTYSGGLGVLAGDTVRSAADLEIPLVGVTLCYNAGYFYQMIDPSGNQVEKEIRWEFASELEKSPAVITLNVRGQTIHVGAWKYDVIGETGHVVPILLLDTDVEQNTPEQRAYTHVLYDATPHQRFVQEMILGVGGVKMLRTLGYNDIETFHMNEGHAALLTLELLRENKGDVDRTKQSCMFTTHTPVGAGHDVFPYEMATPFMGDLAPEDKEFRQFGGKDALNMSMLALNLSRYANAVARKHGEVAARMFPDHQIDSITNGVHASFWVCPPMQDLYDRSFPGWRHRPELLTHAEEINDKALWKAHQRAKTALHDYAKSHSWVLLDKKLLTIGFARRITGYKRPTLMFRDFHRLGKLCKGKVQFVFAGKTHPRDHEGKNFIRRINEVSDHIWDQYRVRVVFLENYDMDLSHLMVSGVDMWLNNPLRYLEASGTSGMKATLNGVPNLSVLDGWWIEGYEMDPMAGWPLGPRPGEKGCEENNDDVEAANIYKRLEREIIPLYYDNRAGWISRMKHAIGLGSYFNTHRMVKEYATRAWGLEEQPLWRSKRSGN